MNEFNYLGHLSRDDPLYGYLTNDILPQTGFQGTGPDFKVYEAPASNHVYVYEESRTRTRVIGKFFGDVRGRSRQAARNLMGREFKKLHYLAGPFLHGPQSASYRAQLLGHPGPPQAVDQGRGQDFEGLGT